jgi:hypothetical protein
VREKKMDVKKNGERIKISFPYDPDDISQKLKQ